MSIIHDILYRTFTFHYSAVMADSDATTQGTAATATQAAQAAGLTVNDDVATRYDDLLALIVRSESMNKEERQYWIDILPVMTPEQVLKLRDILANERDQLAAIDAKYSKEIAKVGAQQTLRHMGEERRQKQTERSVAEQSDRADESQEAEDLLKKMQEL